MFTLDANGQTTDEVLGKGAMNLGKKPSRRRFRFRKCCIPGCTEETSYLKLHAYMRHVPGIFSERLKPDDEYVLRERRNALNQVTRWFLGRAAPLEDLLSFMMGERMLSSAEMIEITPRQDIAMLEFCKFMNLPIPEVFKLEPANSTGVLIHWKAILIIAANLTEEERLFWRDTYPVPEYLEFQEPEEVLPKAFDGHFHLDRTLEKLNLQSGTIRDIDACVSVDNDKRVQLIGTVAVFSDPKSYPTEQDVLDMPEDMYISIGYHPKYARNSVRTIEANLIELTKLLEHPCVIALGDIGIDHSQPMKYWAYQIELLEKVLPKLENHHVLTLHCRGMKDDCGTEAYLLLLHYVKKCVQPNQLIHLHCFTGNHYIVQRWLESFPRTFFGFTNLARSFNTDQIAALSCIEETRLILESNAPYFPMMRSQISSPSQLFTVAQTIASHRQMTVERVLELTVANAEHLYTSQLK